MNMIGNLKFNHEYKWKAGMMKLSQTIQCTKLVGEPGQLDYDPAVCRVWATQNAGKKFQGKLQMPTQVVVG